MDQTYGVDNLVRSGLQPARSRARVGERGGRNALSLGVKTTHFDVLLARLSTSEESAAVVVEQRK